MRMTASPSALGLPANMAMRRPSSLFDLLRRERDELVGSSTEWTSPYRSTIRNHGVASGDGIAAEAAPVPVNTGVGAASAAIGQRIGAIVA